MSSGIPGCMLAACLTAGPPGPSEAGVGRVRQPNKPRTSREESLTPVLAPAVRGRSRGVRPNFILVLPRSGGEPCLGLHSAWGAELGPGGG